MHAAANRAFRLLRDVREREREREAKLLASVSIPVETARPVFGHVIITTPM
jgi:hypothetical protein